MVNCSVACCKRRSGTSTMRKNGVSYHMFPRDLLWREQWIKFCDNNPEWEPTRRSVVCSDHFTSSCWLPLSNKRRRLVDGAVPTVYSNSAEIIENTSTGQESIECSKILLATGQIPTASQIEELIDVHPHVRKLKSQLSMKIKKIKRLQSKVLYMQKKLTYTEEQFQKLKIESQKYRRLQLHLKKKSLDSARFSKKQIIPSLKKVLVIKRALFNT